MPSAAGIIFATGAMTLANDALQNNAPLSQAADHINWKVIPATAIAAAIFYGFEQVNATLAKAVAALAFLTAFTAPINIGEPGTTTSPLGTLLKATGITVRDNMGMVEPFYKGEASTVWIQPNGSGTYDLNNYRQSFAPYS